MSIIVADCSSNHLGNMDLIGSMIEEAAEVGVNIIKFQAWQADQLRRKYPDYFFNYNRYKKTELSRQAQEHIIKTCKLHKIEPLFTVFNLENARLCLELGQKQVKIASPDCNNGELILFCANNFKKVIISTGMHHCDEILTLKHFLTSKNIMNKVTILHCVSLYPCPMNQINMCQVNFLKKHFNEWGYSDHSIGTDACKHAISLGAKIVEKHFTLNTKLPAVDAKISGTAKDFSEIVDWNVKVSAMKGTPVTTLSNEIIEMRKKYIGKWSG